MIKFVVRKVVIDKPLFEGLEIGVVGIAEGEDAGFAEDLATKLFVDLLPEGVAIDHDVEIEGIGVIEADDAGVAVGRTLGVEQIELIVEGDLMAPGLALEGGVEAHDSCTDDGDFHRFEFTWRGGW